MTPSSNVIPDAYDGREQALIKHTLLKGYLEKLFLIIGMSPRQRLSELCYVDCFAGPWEVEDDELTSSSIAISLGILARCRNELDKRGVRRTIRALFIEKDDDAFGRLQAYLAEKTPSGIEAHAFHGEFLNLRDKALEWCGNAAFAFFFVDPTGWSPVTINYLKLLLARPKSEFLVTFVYDWINRTASMPGWENRVRDLVGEPLNLGGLDPAEREETVLTAYRRNLCRAMTTEVNRPSRSAYVRVLDPTKARPKYHLVYLTRHPRGIIEFKKMSEEVDLVQREVRATKKDEARAMQSGTADMFGAASFVDTKFGRVDPNDVEAYWLDYLAPTGRIVGETEFAELLEQTDWFPSDFQAALVRLIDSGAVRNRNATKRRPKNPLHWDKDSEYLELLDRNL